MKIQIRKFRKIDYGRFIKLKLSKETSKDFDRSLFGYAVEGLKSLINRKRIYKFAILDEKKFIGFASIMNIRNFYELGIYVLPEYRCKGVATFVAKKLISISFKKLKMKNIMAVCDENREDAKKILKKLKFKFVKKNDREKTLLWERKK